jgi:cell division protein FtsW
MSATARPQGWQRLTAAMGRRVGGFARAAQEALPVRTHSSEFVQSRPLAVRDMGFDQPLVWVVVALLMWSVVMVYSASVALPDNPKFARYAHTHFLVRHALFIMVGLVGALLAFQVPMRTWERAAPWLFMVSILLLVLVLVPFIGKGVNGARRWFSLGPISFQPSELAKLAVLLYAADYMVRRMEVKERFFRAVIPMAVAVLVVGVLLLAEPDMGAFMVIVVIAMGILFLGGVNARMFFLMALLVVGAFAMIVLTSSWRRERIFAYLDPWSEQHALGKGYQLSHALIAFGRGEIFGVGLGGQCGKAALAARGAYRFSAGRHWRRIRAAGRAGGDGLFMWLTRRIMHIGRQAIALDQVFAGLVAQGVGLWVGFQAFINIGVNLGALPTKGLTLPLMSYGGSAILLNLTALAIVLRVDVENRVLMKGGRI